MAFYILLSHKKKLIKWVIVLSIGIISVKSDLRIMMDYKIEKFICNSGDVLLITSSDQWNNIQKFILYRCDTLDKRLVF